MRTHPFDVIYSQLLLGAAIELHPVVSRALDPDYMTELVVILRVRSIGRSLIILLVGTATLNLPRVTFFHDNLITVLRASAHRPASRPMLPSKRVLSNLQRSTPYYVLIVHRLAEFFGFFGFLGLSGLLLLISRCRVLERFLLGLLG